MTRIKIKPGDLFIDHHDGEIVMALSPTQFTATWYVAVLLRSRGFIRDIYGEPCKRALAYYDSPYQRWERIA